MADLLECLLQVRGLRVSLTRLENLAGRAGRAGGDIAPAAEETIAAMLAAGEGWRQVLAALLPLPASGETPPPGGAIPLSQFRHQRLETLAALDTCSAHDLASMVALEDGRQVTVADVVAHMLADDTERLGRLRQIVEDGEETPM
jgi:hypothetical protein